MRGALGFPLSFLQNRSGQTPPPAAPAVLHGFSEIGDLNSSNAKLGLKFREHRSDYLDDDFALFLLASNQCAPQTFGSTLCLTSLGP